jgi:hypothetical protein
MLSRAAEVEDYLSQLPRASDTSTQVVYVVQAESGGPVKIGHSTRTGVERRLRELQSGNAQRLVVRALFDGGMWLEQALHQFFCESRLRGEWFGLTPQLLLLCPEVVD